MNIYRIRLNGYNMYVNVVASDDKTALKMAERHFRFIFNANDFNIDGVPIASMLEIYGQDYCIVAR